MAAFTASRYTAGSRREIDDQDQEAGLTSNPSYDWDFGATRRRHDAKDTQRHTYVNAGAYTWKVTVSDPACGAKASVATTAHDRRHRGRHQGPAAEAGQGGRKGSAGHTQARLPGRRHRSSSSLKAGEDTIKPKNLTAPAAQRTSRSRCRRACGNTRSASLVVRSRRPAGPLPTTVLRQHPPALTPPATAAEAACHRFSQKCPRSPRVVLVHGTDLTYDFRMATPRERRLFPRVDVSAPIFARPLSRDPQLARGDAIGGALLNASRGGVAFACPEAVSPGDLVELAVRTGDGSAVLERYGRVVACDGARRRDRRAVLVRRADARHDVDRRAAGRGVRRRARGRRLSRLLARPAAAALAVAPGSLP